MPERILQLLRKIAYYFRRNNFDRDLEEEMRFHLEMKTEANMRSGMPADQARQAAHIEVGNQTRLREVSRDVWSFRFVETLLKDAHFSIRSFIKNPVFAIVIILTLAISIGANTVIFSVINGVLLRPLSYSQPDRLVWLWSGQMASDEYPHSPGDFLDYQSQNHSFEQMAAFRHLGFTLMDNDQPERVIGMVVCELFLATRRSAANWSQFHGG